MKKKSLNTRFYLMYGIALLPLILYGLYKNGIELYQKGLVDILNMLKPFIMLFISIAGSLLGGILREASKTKKFDFSILNKCKTDIIEAILVVSILPIKTSPIIIFLTTLIFSLVLNRIKINRIALMYIIIESINVLCGLNSFNNAYETNTILNYDGLDLFWGLGKGGIFSTSILFITTGLIFLSFNKLYKRELVYSSIGSFLTLSLIYYTIKSAYTEILPYIFGYNILFILVFIAPNLYSSSYTVKGQIVSGFLIGILTFILSFFTPYTSGILGVLIVSFLSNFIDRVFVIKKEKIK